MIFQLLRATTTAAVAAIVLLGSSCGYRVSGHADLLPKTIKTIAIPSWGNLTVRYKLADQLPRAIGREFISRTRYQIVADPNEADAVLNGSLLQFNAFPTVTDPISQRATGVQMIVVLQLQLVERATGKVLFNRPAYEARQRYEISVDQIAYFEESSAALERISREVSRGVVSEILEAF